MVATSKLDQTDWN